MEQHFLVLTSNYPYLVSTDQELVDIGLKLVGIDQQLSLKDDATFLSINQQLAIFGQY